MNVDDPLAHMGFSIAMASDAQRMRDNLLPAVLEEARRYHLIANGEDCFRRYFSLKWPIYFAVSEEELEDSYLPLTWWDNYAAAWLEVQERICMKAWECRLDILEAGA